MIDEILNFLLGLVDGTYDNDNDDEKSKVKLCERETIKKLRRK